MEKGWAGEVKKYKDDEVIFKENDIGTEMYVILSGRVRIIKEIDGKETILSTLKEEDIFGEMALFDKFPRSATVKAEGDAEVAIFDRQTLLEQIRKSPNLAIHIIQKMSQRIRQIDTQLQNLLLVLRERRT